MDHINHAPLLFFMREAQILTDRRESADLARGIDATGALVMNSKPTEALPEVHR
jgi:hypothetical protein